MDMHIARLAGTSWHQITDWQVFAMRTVWMFAHGPRTAPGSASNADLQRLPSLDWPPDLFADEEPCH